MIRVALLLPLLLSSTAAAQTSGKSQDTQDTSSGVTLHAHTAPVFEARRDLTVIAALAAVTVATMPFDSRIQRAFGANDQPRTRSLARTAETISTLGESGTIVASLAMYGLGRATHASTLAMLGAHATEAIVMGGVTTDVLKLLVGRQRPNIRPGDADDFVIGRGFRESNSSFPSGHTTVAFAFAAAMTEDVRALRPQSARLMGTLLYGGATLVGLSRIYGNQHWASDIVMGAGIGTLAGYQTVAFAHAHPNNWLARHLQAVNITPALDAGKAVTVRIVMVMPRG